VYPQLSLGLQTAGASTQQQRTAAASKLQQQLAATGGSSNSFHSSQGVETTGRCIAATHKVM